METGLLHLHKTLAYLVFLAAILNLALALGRNIKASAKILGWCHRLGLLMAGRITLVLGLIYVFTAGYPLGTWWLWVCLLLWGPVEAMGRRFVKPEIALVQEGGQASLRLVSGTGIQLVCVLLIFGLMSIHP